MNLKLLFVLFSILGIAIYLFFVYNEKISNALIFFNSIKIFGYNVSENDQEFNFDYDFLLKQANMSRTRFPAIPYISGNSFKGLADHDGMHAKFNPDLVKCAEIVYVKCELIDKFFANIHPNITESYILLTHNSDYPAGKNNTIKFLNESNLIAWYGQNVITK